MKQREYFKTVRFRTQVPLAVDLDWSDFFAWSVRERTAGIAFQNYRLQGRDRLIFESVAARFASLRNALIARNVMVASQLRELTRAWHGLEWMVIKGAWLAAHVYRDPGVRDMTDIDVVVRPADVPAAHDALVRLGYALQIDLRSALAAASPVHSVLYVASEPSGGDPSASVARDTARAARIHLHWDFQNVSLPVASSNRLTQETWAGARIVNDGETRYRVPRPDHAFVLLCDHAMKHSFSVALYFSDLSAFLDGVPVEPDEIAATARRWGLDRPVYYACELGARLLGHSRMREIADRVRPAALGWEGRWLLKSILSGRRRDGLSALGYLSMLSRKREKLRFAYRSFVPTPAAMETFGKRPTVGGYVSRAVRGVRMLLRAFLG